MQVTFILKDFTDAFYNGTEGGSIVGLLNMADADKFDKLKRMAAERRVSMKIASGQFRDAVELNQLLRSACRFMFKLEPRKGYKLATFEVAKA